MDTIVLVHGLWMTGLEMTLLRWRLRSRGYRLYQFHYRTVGRDLAANAERLHHFLHQHVTGERVHLVAHSLGGLVVRRLFHDFPHQRPGRIVTLGSPHQGSYVAKRLARSGLLRHLFGRSLPALRGEVPPWGGERELGSLAGRLPVGLGMIVRDLPRPNDGTVAVVETQLGGMSDHKVVRASHVTLLFSREVVREVDTFLQHGHFQR